MVDMAIPKCLLREPGIWRTWSSGRARFPTQRKQIVGLFSVQTNVMVRLRAVSASIVWPESA